MELISQFLDVLHHLPEHLQAWATDYGPAFYLILFLIVFAETGLVVTPFLPGDSLLFAAGTVVALHSGLNLFVLMGILIAAAVIGDTLNYHVGKWMAPRLFKDYEAPSLSKWLNKKHLERTQEFYAKHGGKTIILARFIPIIRTYSPFVAGLSGVPFKRFFFFSVSGGVIWVCSFTSIGFFFGNVPAIKSNFQYVILAILVISVLPIMIEFIKARRKPA